MYDENQLVQMRWERGTKKYYESKGYVYTGIGDVFDVVVKDLPSKSHARIVLTCDYCGEKYEATLGNVTKSRSIIEKDACTNCKYEKNSEVSKIRNARKLLGRARNICEENGYELLTTEDEYENAHMTIMILCPKHGEQHVNLWAFLSGARCPRCGIETSMSKQRLDIDYIEQYVNGINGNKLLNKEDYINRKVCNLRILCSCGKEYTTSFECYLVGVQRCYSCSCRESLREREIRCLLESYDVEFEKEKKFDDCFDILPLPFDFYLPDYNLCIEFDGEHHYKPIFGEEQHLKTKKHDEIKNQYCQLNNINLLRIPYWEGHNIEEIISKQLNL